MASGIQIIERDIEVLDKALKAIAQEFHDTYREYLELLGKAVRQQLVLASYHLCTQGYPDQFLQLSLQQRQDLQRAIRELGKKAQEQLLSQLQSVDTLPVTDAEVAPRSAEPDSIVSELIATEESAIAPVADLGVPKHLSHWQEQLEEAIVNVLQELSHAANRCFQEAAIVSKKLPEPVLEIASKAEMIAEASTTNMPNLLKLRVEAESNDDEAEEAEVTQLIVIHLRLSEIEFSNPTLSPWRIKIRELSNRLNQMKRDYRRKQRERSIAQAEAAWRSSWFED